MGYELVWEAPVGVVKRHFGQVTGQDLLEAVLRTEGDRRFDRLRYVINDFTDCTGLSVSRSELEEIAAIDKAAHAINPRILIAVVGSHPAVVSAGISYSDAAMDSYQTRLFDALPDARAWLETALGHRQEPSR